MNLFTDNVPTLAVQAPIIREVPKTFCPTTVYSMDTGIVNRIAGETEEKIMERDSILRRLATLEKGALICKQYAKRPQQGKHHQIPSRRIQANGSSSQPLIRWDWPFRAIRSRPQNARERGQEYPRKTILYSQTFSRVSSQGWKHSQSLQSSIGPLSNREWKP